MLNKYPALHRAVACLSLVLLIVSTLTAQQSASPVSGPGEIAPPKIVVLQGRGAVYDVHRSEPAFIVVEIRDANDKPIEGADVVFQAPETGPSGAFAGRKRSFQTTTGFQGQAGAAFLPNDETGKYSIQVKATYRSSTGQLSISQTNGTRSAEMDHPRTKSHLWLWLLIGGAAGGTAAAVLLGRSTTSRSTITVVPGAPTITTPP